MSVFKNPASMTNDELLKALEEMTIERFKAAQLIGKRKMSFKDTYRIQIDLQAELRKRMFEPSYYRHTNGTVYMHAIESTDEVTHETLTTYISPEGKPWTRKHEVFHGLNDAGEKRFTRVSGAEPQPPQEEKKRYTLVFLCKSFSTKAKLKNPATLEEARALGKKDELEKPHQKFIGVLNVDVKDSEITKLLEEFAAE